jgi:probable HAF family extracellular repeat protein
LNGARLADTGFVAARGRTIIAVFTSFRLLRGMPIVRHPGTWCVRLKQSSTWTSSRVSRRSVLAAAGFAVLKRSQSGLAQELAFDITELAADISKLTGTFGRAINRKATIVGIATNEAGPVAVRSRGKTAWSLPSTDLPSVANAINDAGLIAGSLDNKACVWEDDEPRLLPDFGSGFAAGYGINSDGLVVGSADKGARNGVALRWTSRKAVELPSLGGPANRAIAVNADGVVVGFSAVDDAGDITHAARWVDDKIEDLGTLGGDVSQATAVNRHGVIVGSSTREDGFSGVDHAFRWLDGSMSMLGRLGRVKVSGRSGKVNLDRSIALGLNDQGEICGSSISASENDPVSVATLWIGEEVVDVNALIGTSARDVV